MKLYKYNQDETVKYWDTQEEIDIPEYKFNEKDVRGVWVSNVANIDTLSNLGKEEYQEYLRNMIKNIASYNMNTVIFQVRPASDAYYESKLNPWSRYITGTEGKNPGFDVLQFVIDEAKKYGCGTVQITASDMGVKLYTDFGFKHNDNFMHYKL